MAGDTPFVGEPADSREAILRATYVALEAYGYAGLSIQRIADEADMSKSTFYHHFDDKEDLLTSFVEFTLEEFTRVLTLELGDDPRANLEIFLEMLVPPSPDVGEGLPEEMDSVVGAYVELRAQAVRDERIRAKFTETDRAVTARVAGIIRDGVEQGIFEPVDPEATATFLLTIVGGHMLRRTTRVDDPTPTLAPKLEEYLESHVYRE